MARGRVPGLQNGEGFHVEHFALTVMYVYIYGVNAKHMKWQMKSRISSGDSDIYQEVG
jgi:hypothetical protein